MPNAESVALTGRLTARPKRDTRDGSVTLHLWPYRGLKPKDCPPTVFLGRQPPHGFEDWEPGDIITARGAVGTVAFGQAGVEARVVLVAQEVGNFGPDLTALASPVPLVRRPATPGRYRLQVRWQAQSDECWEIQTHHGGFSTAEEAALFGSGYGTAAVSDLRLRDGRFCLQLSDGGEAILRGLSLKAFRLRSGDVTNEQPVAVSLLRKNLPSDEIFTPLHFKVLGPGDQQLDVSVDETAGDLLRVTVSPIRADTRRAYKSSR